MKKLPLLLVLGFVPSLFAAPVVNPTPSTVPGQPWSAPGAASLSGVGSNYLTITQNVDRVVLNWNTFSIGAGNTTQFIQPSSNSAALNRVLGGQTSVINGTLLANGQVFLLNGNGIVVGPGGIISTAGFTGSTRDISDSDFMSNNLHFVGSGDGGVTNLGTISALGGNVVLLGKTVNNAGTIKATGTAALVAGDDILLAQQNTDGSTVTVNPVGSPTAATNKVGVKNTGVIEASSAELKAANGNIYALAIQNEGMIQATTVKQQGGHIYLTSDDGTIVNSGTLNASATVAGGKGGTILVKSTKGKVVHSGAIVARGGTGGAGGNVEVSAPVVEFTGTVDLRADGGTTGSLLLDPLNEVVNTTGTGSAPNTSYISNSSVDGLLNNTDFALNAGNSVTVGAEIDWNSSSTLTLSTSNVGSTIAINAPINGPSGSLVLDTAGPADLITTSLSGTVDVNNFTLQAGAWLQLVNDGSGNGGDIPQTIIPVQGGSPEIENILPTFTVTGDFEIQGGTFLRADSGNGTTVYYGLEDIFGVQGMNGFLNSNFTLNGREIDASVTSNWNPTTVNSDNEDADVESFNQGFNPIGSGNEGGFQGNLTNGSIDNLYINRPTGSDVGLISLLRSSGAVDDNDNLTSGEVQNLQLYSATITGATEVGGVVGTNLGAIDNVTVGYSTITGNEEVGALVGYQQNGYLNDSVVQIHTNGSYVYSTTVNGDSHVGGVVGENAGQIDGATVDSNTTVTGNGWVGGVAGSNDYTTENGPTATITYATFAGGVQFTDDNANDGSSFDLGGIAGQNDGMIQNSNTFPGATVSGDSDVGGIAGFNTGTIQDSYNSATVTGSSGDGVGFDIGGIVGENGGLENEANSDNSVRRFASESINQPNFIQYGTVQTSYNTGSVTGTTYVGGLVGSNDYSNNTVNTAYNVGSVTGTTYVGGIVGDNSGTVEYVYNSGPVSGGDVETTGALVGFDEDGATTQNAYWDTSTSGVATATNSNTDDDNSATELNIGTISTTGSAYEIDNNNTDSGAGYGFFGTATPESDVSGNLNNGVYVIGTTPDDGESPAWYILPGETRPMLTMEFTGNIENPHELQLISTDLGGNFYVGQNINMSVVQNPSEVWASTGFSPIGGDPNEEQNDFSGQFYGNYETISGLYINRSTQNNVGLFGVVDSDATVNDVYFSGGSITGAQDVGEVAGTNSGSFYTVSVNDATVTGTSDVGGLAGYNTQGALISSGTATTDGSGLITGTGHYTGGIAGENGGTITLSTNALPVTGNTQVGGIAGRNDPGGSVTEDGNTGTITGVLPVGDQDEEDQSMEIGGVVGQNYGTVSQTYNLGDVGTADDLLVGGIAGLNASQVDDSYSGGGFSQGTITGSDRVGGLLGENDGTLETSYSTSEIISEGAASGFLVGYNFGPVSRTYWDTDTAGAFNNIGTNGFGSSETDVVGFTTAQLSDSRNFGQGEQPQLWNFSPEGTTNPGPWGIDVYQANYVYNQETGYTLVTSQVNDGLPVLQWQTPVNVQVTATSGTQYYGYTPGYTATGSGASQLAQNGGVTVTTTGGNQAGDTDTLVATPTTINTTSFNEEFTNGTVVIIPAPLDIVANSYNVPVGSMAPVFGAAYEGLQNGDTPSSLAGTLEFTVNPNATASPGQYSIGVSGVNSSNYNITFLPGVLDVGSKGTQSQTLSSVEGEINTIGSFFANDPADGLDPIYFLVIPNQFGLGGDLLGAINNEPDATDYAFASSTSHLPAFSRLVVPGTGVVEIIGGVIVVGSPQTGNPIFLSNPGGFLPPAVVANLQGVLSPSAYNQLLALINGNH